MFKGSSDGQFIFGIKFFFNMVDDGEDNFVFFVFFVFNGLDVGVIDVGKKQVFGYNGYVIVFFGGCMFVIMFMQDFGLFFGVEVGFQFVFLVEVMMFFVVVYVVVVGDIVRVGIVDEVFDFFVIFVVGFVFVFIVDFGFDIEQIVYIGRFVMFFVVVLCDLSQ